LHRGQKDNSDSATLRKTKNKKIEKEKKDMKAFLKNGDHGLVEAMVSIWNINQYG
jgi:hypothetical protein